MRQDYENTDQTDDDGNNLREMHYYPPAIFRRPPNWNHGGLLSRIDFEHGLKGRLLKEIYVCLQNKCERAGVMLIRALLEHIFIEKVGDKGTFGGNLDEFEKQGFIAKVDRNSIRDVLEAGHATMHRGFLPSGSDLMTIMDIVESLIERLYVHPKQTKKLKENIPRRRKRKK